ncbi:hypothetical protein SynMVIR181_00605 [Synechococcus sp. MVIR-18-1]|nr:hypothetical protein SynMVIR181_00605 [Synechococcus sp. MVIR-18-1]
MNGPTSNQEATCLYNQWLADLRITRDTTDFTFRRMCSEDLIELQQKAQVLMDSGELDSQQQTKMKLVTQRSVSQWITWLKASRTNNLL